MYYRYDASGNRIAKEAWKLTGFNSNGDPIFDDVQKLTTFYVRDAQGNVMSTYERSNRYVSGQTYEATVKQNEISLYGSDRLGQYKPDNVLVKNLYETTNNNTPNFLEAELRTENTHLITSKQDNLPNTTPSFDITGITNFANVAPAQVNTILQTSIVGESSDNVAIGENLKGEMQIYSVVAKDYFGQPNVCLLYDKNGLLVQNADNIFADANSKNIITRHPTQENKYWLFSRNKLGELFRSEILVTSTQTAVTAKNIPIAATSRVGAHFTAVERRGENATILLYATRNNTATQKAEVFVVSMNATAVAVLPTIAQLPYTETDLYHGGELQISPDGKQLLWYHLGQRAAFFDYQNLKPHSFILGDNMAGVVANPAGTAIIPTEIPGTPTLGNPNPDAVSNPLRSAFTLKTHASIDIDKVENENNIYFTQKTINNIDNLYKNSILQLGATTAGNLRRGKISGEVRQAVGLGTGLPVQVHTLLDTPASAPTRVQASRLLRVRSFELKDHLGNIRVLVADQKDANAAAQVQSYYNYYAFGMEMPNRTYDAGKGYRYGINGKEKDNDINQQNYDFGARIYDSRIARWLSLDPLMVKYPSLTPYNYVDNSPNDSKDDDGKDIIILSARRDAYDPHKEGAHPTGHQAVLIGDEENGYKYYSFDSPSGGAHGDGKSVGVYFRTLEQFANSSHNTYDGKGLETSHRDGKDGKEGKILQRYTQAYRVVLNNKQRPIDDAKAQKAVEKYLKNNSYGLDVLFGYIVLPVGAVCTGPGKVALRVTGCNTGVGDGLSTNMPNTRARRIAKRNVFGYDASSEIKMTDASPKSTSTNEGIKAASVTSTK